MLDRGSDSPHPSKYSSRGIAMRKWVASLRSTPPCACGHDEQLTGRPKVPMR